ncbi:transcriptional regulator [Kiritimatiellota bacterium B12222]|nr:transcriptional regulator [Kiritimatiellota bacterium B12222]
MEILNKPLWNDLEKSIHEPARLALITRLCAEKDGLGFQDLKSECGLTDGNLSRHLKVLEEAGIIHLHKVGKGRRSHTCVKLTPDGREAFLRYLYSLEKVLHGALDALELDTAEFPAGLPLAAS